MLETVRINPDQFAIIADDLAWGGLQREAIRLQAVEGLQDHEIAETLGVPVSQWVYEKRTAEAQLLRYIDKPRKRVAAGQEAIHAMRGPRRPDPNSPALRLCPYTGQWIAVALRSPLVNAADDLDSEGDYWRYVTDDKGRLVWVPKSGAERLAVWMEV